MPFLDTNVILRYITQDDPAQGAKTRGFILNLAAGHVTAKLTEGVLIEAVQVVSSKMLYAMPRTQIRDDLSAIIALAGVRIPRKGMYINALDLYASRPHLDFVDALLVARMEHGNDHTIYSFDRDFDRVQGIVRQEP